MAGPFNEPPFSPSPFHYSGMGVVLKQDGSWRVITHLSATRGTLFAKIDLAKAFRQCPVRAADWHLLGLQWRGKLYYDKCLPFGLHSPPFSLTL